MADTRKRKIVRSRPFVERQVTFYSYDAQQILMGFGRLAGAMYRLGIALRAYLPAERVSALTDAIYEELVTPLEQEIADDLDRLQKQQREAKNIKVDYSNPIQRTLHITYPQALRVLDLAQNLDTLVCLLSPLWFARVIKDEEFFALKEKYRNTLVDIARRITTLATTKMEEAKAQVAAREEQARAKKSKAATAQDAEPAPAPHTEPAGGQESGLPTAEVIPLAAAGQ